MSAHVSSRVPSAVTPDWYGCPPSEWTRTKLKYLFQERSEKSSGTFPPGAISFGEVVEKEMHNEDTLASYQDVFSGDFLVNPINLNYDLKSLRVAHSRMNVRVSPAYIVLRDTGAAEPRYLRWLMHQFDVAHMKTLGAGVRQTITFGDMGPCQAFLPPRSEQRQIANFLDEQTARIDALIAQKERLLASVREYAAAEISRLLTEGVRGEALVETGNPFFPRAPGSWRLAAFKRALAGMEQGWSPQCENRPAESHEWGVLKVGCVNGSRFNAEENKALPRELEPDLACVLKAGDVLVSRANTRELVGMAALVEGDHPNLLLCDKLYRLRLRPEWIEPEFAVLALRAHPGRRQIELGASGASASMLNISQDVLRELYLAFPPWDEQCAIVKQAGQVRAATEVLAEHVMEHVDRLREYRSSLISAAVTGQLDAGSFNFAKAA